MLGILSLALLGVLAFFFTRRRRQKRIQKEFDGNFDPAATDKRSSTFTSVRGPLGGPDDGGGTLPNVGTDEELLHDDGMGGRLSDIGGIPFILPPSSPTSRTSADEPRRISDEKTFSDTRSMRPISAQTTGSSFNPYVGYPPSSPLHQLHRRHSSTPSSSPHPPSSFSYSNADRPISPATTRSEYTPAPSSQSSSSSVAVKEREARSGFVVTNPNPESDLFGSGTCVTRA